MRDHILCSKIKLDKKNEENISLINELTEMKNFCRCLEEENDKLKHQIDYERTKSNESHQLKLSVENELEKSIDKLRTQRYEYENQISILDQTFKSSQRTIEDKYEKEMQRLKDHIRQLELKIEEVIQDKSSVSIRCGELIEENRKLEKALNDKEDDYEEKINGYKEKNSLLITQIEDAEKKLIETKKQLEIITIEKDETLADMLVAVRVASELRHGMYWKELEMNVIGLF